MAVVVYYCSPVPFLFYFLTQRINIIKNRIMALYDAVVVDLETNGLLKDNSIVQFFTWFLQAGKIRKVINRYNFFPWKKLIVKR